MSPTTQHAKRRLKQRRIDIGLLKDIDSLAEPLSSVKHLVTPMLHDRPVGFRYAGQSYKADTKRISTLIQCGSYTFVVGLDDKRGNPVVVTAWKS